MTRLRIEPRPGALPLARRWARRQAQRAKLSARDIHVVELLTSELVANAITHGPAATIDVTVEVTRHTFTIKVTDGGDDLPVMRTTGPEVPGGHGVRLVDRLAATWGVEKEPYGGKTVWFSLSGRG